MLHFFDLKDRSAYVPVEIYVHRQSQTDIWKVHLIFEFISSLKNNSDVYSCFEGILQNTLTNIGVMCREAYTWCRDLASAILCSHLYLYLFMFLHIMFQSKMKFISNYMYSMYPLISILPYLLLLHFHSIYIFRIFTMGYARRQHMYNSHPSSSQPSSNSSSSSSASSHTYFVQHQK